MQDLVWDYEKSSLSSKNHNSKFCLQFSNAYDIENYDCLLDFKMGNTS